MALRPIFLATFNQKLVSKEFVEFNWFPGFSTSQKQKSIDSLHEEIKKIYSENNILEISTKSKNELGNSLSAFNLLIKTKNNITFSVESAFQASKVFENGGPYNDILTMPSKEAKKDNRLRNSGNVIGFKYFDREFPAEPRTFFYNWLYINALDMNKKLGKEVLEYDTFTDIEFNPKRSINCQAEAVAMYVSLVKTNQLNYALKDEKSFNKIVYSHTEDIPLVQEKLF